MQRRTLAEIRSHGLGPFAWRYGVLWFGGPFFFVNTIVHWLINDPAQRYILQIDILLAIMSFVYSLMAGAAFGIVAWFVLTAFARIRRPAENTAAHPVLVKSQSASSNN
jgi:hypothetical protein